MNEATTPEDGGRVALDRLIRGFQVSRMLRAVADVGLADRIARNGRREVAELATECGVASLPNTGMSPSVWNVSHATPCGSSIQYLSESA